MRAFFDTIQNLTNTIRFVFGIFALGIMVFGLFVTIGASYVGHKAVDSIGERAERLGEKAIRAEQEQRRAQELAKDGWGYRPSDNSDKPSARRRDSESVKNGWGD
ncbi:MAG: hypothetical protein NWP98_08675 [Erythrobacter sp.]|nr:hypothetical protein [Erythrobacter sp.]